MFGRVRIAVVTLIVLGLAVAACAQQDIPDALKAAPAMCQAGGALGAAGAIGAVGTAGSMGSAAAAFSKLGLKPETVAKAVPVLTTYVSKTGGAGVGLLLAGALK